ncbi:unnamed protein product [Heterobilharzia americana]|nr:unnamed protein product [Heterobilharzia americana]
MDAQSSCEYTSTVLSYEFVCSQCDRSFTTSQACKMHARIHKQNKKFNRTNDLTNGNLNEAVDNANHRKESLIESRYRTILPKPSSKQTSSVQFSLLDLKPRRRNARRQTTSSTSSSYEQILSCKKQINHNNVVNNSSARIYSYSDENPQSYSNSTNIFYQSTANNRDNPVNSSNNNHINLSDQIIYDSVTNTSDEICKPSHLLTVASAYASQIPFSPRSSNDTSHSMDNVITDATIVPISADSSIPNIQIYPIPWSSNAHNSSLLSSDTTVVSNVIVNQSIDTSVSCISDNNNNNNNNNNNDNNNNNNQLHTVKAVSTDCASSFTHESSAPYSFIQLYPVMSSDGTLYYITGTPIELTQTDSNDPNHQIGIFSHNTIVSTNCEPEYAYSANEIWSSNEPNTGNINNNNNNNTANINSSLSQQITTTEINSTLHANSTTSDSYLINAESCSSKNNEGTVYLSSHYNSVPENCQPVLEYLSNDVEVIDLNIPAAVVHLDQNTLPSTIVLNASQLATTLYEINSLGNQNFTVSYSNPTDSVLKCGSEGATFPEQQQHQQQSPGVGCSETQNNFDSNGNSDPLAVLNCNSSVKDSRISEKSQISLNHSFNDSSLNNEVNNKIDYESLKHLKEYFDFNKTTIKICNNSVYTVKSSLDNNLINNSLVTDDLHNSSSDFNDSSFTSVCHLPTSV